MSGWTAGPVVTLADLGALGAPLSRDDGESLGIYPVPRHPGWLVKLYKAPQEPAHATRLDELVALPGHLPPADRDVLRGHTCWPVARVNDHSARTIGCVLPEAPGTYKIRFNSTGERFLEVDFLAKPDEAFTRRGLSVPSGPDRLQVCTSIAAIGAVLERNALVYSDWSYSNAFWSFTGRTAYLIDIDGVGFRVKQNLSQPNWQDPLTPLDQPADGYTDRYRIGLLIARCLTGERDLVRVLHSIAGLPQQGLSALLLDLLLATDRARRPTISALHAALTGLPYVRVPVDRMPLPPMPAHAPPQRVVPTVPPHHTAAPATTASAGPSGWVVLAVVVVLALLLLICIATTS
jgi:hypothetical protein